MMKPSNSAITKIKRMMESFEIPQLQPRSPSQFLDLHKDLLGVSAARCWRELGSNFKSGRGSAQPPGTSGGFVFHPSTSLPCGSGRPRT